MCGNFGLFDSHTKIIGDSPIFDYLSSVTQAVKY